MHRYEIWYGSDGDYIILASLVDGRWKNHTQWLIPGTQLED